MKQLVQSPAQAARSTKMRDVMLLASNPSVDKVSGFNFRSAEELEVFVQELQKNLDATSIQLKRLQRLFAKSEQKAASTTMEFDRGAKTQPKKPKDFESLTVAPISIKNMKKLTENYDLIANLQQRLEVLDTLEAQYEYLFSGSRTKVGPALKATKREYETKIKEVLKFLNQVAKKHEPPEFTEIVNGIMGTFYKQMKDKFSGVSQKVYVTTKQIEGANNDLLVFSHYVEFADLKNDAQDYVYPEYYVVFTATVNSAGKMTCFVNTLHKFRAPGTFKPGTSFTNVKQGSNKLAALLAADEFVDLLERQKIPVTDDEIDLKKFTSKDVIGDIRILEDNVLQVSFTNAVNNQNKQVVAEKVLRDIHVLLAGKTSGRIKYKIRQVNAERFRMECVLVLPHEMDEKALTPQKIDKLKEDFGFDDKDVKALQSILQRGH